MGIKKLSSGLSWFWGFNRIIRLGRRGGRGGLIPHKHLGKNNNGIWSLRVTFMY